MDTELTEIQEKFRANERRPKNDREVSIDYLNCIATHRTIKVKVNSQEVYNLGALMQKTYCE